MGLVNGPINGLVGQLAARQPQVAVCRSVNGLMLTDEWFGRPTCGPRAESCPGVYRSVNGLMCTDEWFRDNNNFRVASIRLIPNLSLKNEIKVGIRLGSLNI